MKKKPANLGIIGRIGIADLNSAPHLVIRKHRSNGATFVLSFALALALTALGYFLWRMH